MKKIIFTAILLLVLGSAWTLYLEYENRRFIESSPKPPANVTREVHTADIPVTPESRENIATVTAPLETEAATESETEVADMFTEDATLHPHPRTNSTSQTKTTDFLSEKSVFESVFDDVEESPTQLPVEECPIGGLGLSPAEMASKQAALKALNRLIWAKPENWVKGRPDEDGFTFEVWTREDAELVQKALGISILPEQSAVPVQNPDVPEFPLPESFPADNL